MISPEDRRWVILNTSETGSIDFTQVCESSPKTLKVTNDGSQTFVKWDKLVAVEQVLYTDDDFDIPEGKSVGDVRIAATASMDTPSSVLSLSTKSQEYTQSEILNILTGSAWVPEAE
tara:strand:+ start:271 stop:621 length:351 start_codon:yes stop_codon:yes gene_type:complete